MLAMAMAIGTSGINVDRHAAIAGKPAPTGFCGVFENCLQEKIHAFGSI
ncbi:hypothetical protein K5R88_04600 [Pseudomonas sp. MM213]|nr:hypothetical protein [Pseudomonas sp. MM213]UCP10922.1 hypothetical protein K5R88_04600 [Pseudomonas sp. MM213]